MPLGDLNDFQKSRSPAKGLNDALTYGESFRRLAAALPWRTSSLMTVASTEADAVNQSLTYFPAKAVSHE